MSLCLQRKSIRKFLDSKVSDDVIERLMMSAMQAPSATNQQPWSFVVIKNRALLEKLSAISKGAWPLKEAPLGILTLYKEETNRPMMVPQDMAAATQNILLEATNQGLGSVWIGVYPREERMEAIENLVPMEVGHKPFSLVALGYPESQSHKKVTHRFDKQKYSVIE